MATRRGLGWLALASLLAACAAPQHQEPVGQAGYLGLGMCPAKEGIQVIAVNPHSPAEAAHFQEGDVIISGDGMDLSLPEGRKSLLWDLRNSGGKKMTFKVNRGRQPITLKVVPQQRDVFAKDELYAALSDEVLSGAKVSVAVVARVNHTRPEFFDSAAALSAWQDGMRNALENTFEGILLNKLLLRCGNYAVADRERTDQVLKELNFQMTGAVSPESAKQLGDLVGASHLLFLDMTRFERSSGDYEDETSARLVAVETGAVLASTKFSQSVRAQ